MASHQVKLKYSGSHFWLVFWMLVFFPVGLALLATASYFEWKGTSYSIRYFGSRFWLGFWTLVFFPVAIVLALVNGFVVDIHQTLENNGTPPNKLIG